MSHSDDRSLQVPNSHILELITAYKTDLSLIEAKRDELDKAFLPPTDEIYDAYYNLNRRLHIACQKERSFHESERGWLVIVDGWVFTFGYSYIPTYLKREPMYFKIHTSYRQVRDDDTWSLIVHRFNNPVY
jgi:hypothetical protein